MEVEDKGVAMRELFTIDLKNYKENGTVGKRPSVRGVIIKNGKIAMMHSLKYDYYKLPCGGIDEGEELRDTLVREVKEESGLVVKKDTIKEFGYVRRIEKGMFEDIFMQENYYYICDVEDDVSSQELDDYEAEEGFTLEFVTPEYAINVNNIGDHKEKVEKQTFTGMLTRENRVLQMVIDELL